jgi:hypothetical protein
LNWKERISVQIARPTNICDMTNADM